MPFTFELDNLMNRDRRVAPTIDPSRAWLHVTDMQVTCTDPQASCFLPGGNGAPSGDECVTACQRVISRCREAGIPVSWSMFGVNDDGSDAGVFLDNVRFWYPNGGSDSKWSDPESEIDPRLGRLPDEPVFRRPKPSVFFGTLFHNYLTAHDIRYLILVGLSTSSCVRNTAIDASNFNIRTLVLADCTTAYDEPGSAATYVEALKNVQGQYGDVITSDEFFAMLDKAGSRAVDRLYRYSLSYQLDPMIS
jgi:biuret amidohydrolase